MMPREEYQHKSADSYATRAKRSTLSRCILLIIIYWLTIQYACAIPAAAQPLSPEPRIVTELKEVSEDFGYMIDVRVINNRYTGMQDLYITPSEEHSYETESFLRTTCAAVAAITSQSPAYQTFIDMVMMNINGELWAISTQSCRNSFSMTSEAKQNAMLGSRLQQLK